MSFEREKKKRKPTNNRHRHHPHHHTNEKRNQTRTTTSLSPSGSPVATMELEFDPSRLPEGFPFATVAELEEFFNFVESAGGPGGALPAEARETMERWFPDLARFLETHTGGGGGAGGGGEEDGGGGDELEEEEEEEEEEVGRS